MVLISTPSFAKARVFTCDQFSGKTLERKASRFNKAIKSASRKYKVSPSFIKAVITVESCFNPLAHGTSGEKGLMQLMPRTARSIGARSTYNSWDNIHGGAKYLRFLLKRFNGNKRYAAAAYNGGPGAVSRQHGPKFRQVRHYSNKVMRAYNKIAGKSVRSKSKSKSKSKINSKKSVRSKKTKRIQKARYLNKHKKSHRKNRSYRIRKGDSLSTIARKTGISMTRLKRLNRLRSTKIRAGKRLRIR
jgi:LysM repeat protein